MYLSEIRHQDTAESFHLEYGIPDCRKAHMMLLNVPVYLVIPLGVSQRPDCIEKEEGEKGEGGLIGLKKLGLCCM